MHRFWYPFLALSVAPLLAFVLPLRAQNSASAPLEDRRKDLNAVFNDYWEDVLRHDPEFASTLGDKRFNDQISDYSVKAVNEKLEREQALMMRLAAIDPTGFTEQENISRELLLRQFTEDQEDAEFKEWEMPVNQMDGIQTVYMRLVPELGFKTVKDYDDWQEVSNATGA